MNTVIYRNGIRYSEKKFKIEADFERLVIENSKTLFGQHSIYIDAKKKIDNSAFGGVIPDGFLFDLTDKDAPEFYIVEVELAKHSFFNHIFPQTTKYFAFFKNPDSQGKLIEKLYEIFNKDSELQNDLKSKIGKREIFKFIKDTIENSQNILMIIDDEKIEFPTIMDTYTNTWGKMIKIAILKEYINMNGGNDTILTMTPDFLNIENIDLVASDTNQINKSTTYTEEFHLDGVNDEIKEIYRNLKLELQNRIPSISFNPQRYYISLRKKKNFAFLKIRKKKLGIVAMATEQKIREKIHNHTIVSLSEPVQNFYNGPCARIEITRNKNMEEIYNLLTEIQK